jgi:hypothetical protein
MTHRALPFAALVSLLVSLALAPPAHAGRAPTPEGIANQCITDMIAEMTRVFQEYVAITDEFSAFAENWLFSRTSTLAELGREFSRQLTRVERVRIVAQTRVNRITERCLHRLERLGASSKVTDAVNGARDSRLSDLLSLQFQAVTSLQGELEDALFPE